MKSVPCQELIYFQGRGWYHCCDLRGPAVSSLLNHPRSTYKQLISRTIPTGVPVPEPWFLRVRVPNVHFPRFTTGEHNTLPVRGPTPRLLGRLRSLSEDLGLLREKRRRRKRFRSFTERPVKGMGSSRPSRTVQIAGRTCYRPRQDEDVSDCYRFHRLVESLYGLFL